MLFLKQKLAALWRWIGSLSGLAGLFLLLKLVDASAVAAALAGVNPLLLLLALLLVLLTTALRAGRWMLLFRQRRVHIPFQRLLNAGLIGSFYGQFLPLSFAVGASLLFTENARSGGRGSDFTAAFVVERLVNLVSLFVATSLVLLIAGPVGLPAALPLTIHLASIASLAGLLCLRQGWGIERVGRLLARLRLPQLAQHCDVLCQALHSDLGQWSAIGRLTMLSLLVNVSEMLASYLVTLAVAGPVPFFSFMPLTALIITLQGVPLTPGSLGTREGLYVFFLGLLGVSELQALSIGLLVLMLNWLRGLVGGLVLLNCKMRAMAVMVSGVRGMGALSQRVLWSRRGPCQVCYNNGNVPYLRQTGVL